MITGATSTWTGVQTFPAPGANKGSIVLTPGTISGTPANGSIWATSSGVFAEVSGTTVSLGSAAPGGSSGQLQYNNTGALGGASALTYSGTTLTSTGDVNLSGNSAIFGMINSSAANWLSAAWFGGVGQFDLTFGSEIELAGVGLSPDGASGSTLDIGNGTLGDKSGRINLATLVAGSQITMPDTGTITNGLDTFRSSFLIAGATTVPNISAPGQGALWTNNTAYSAGTANGGKLVGLGLEIAGTPYNNCNTPPGSVCDNFGLVFANSLGYVVAGVQSGGGSLGQWFTIGLNRIMPAPTTGASETATQQSQLYIGDAYVTGSATAPGLTFAIGGTNNCIVGVGQKAVGSTDLRLGCVGNLETVWDDSSTDQTDLSTAGCIEFGTASGTIYGGGAGVTWNERVCDGGGYLEAYNDAKSAATGFMAAFVRLAPTTVSGLSTADPSPSDGDRAMVTDATACTFGSTIAGSGSTKCPVYYDGAAWRAG